jgi:opacity protein-like surface antigen
MSRFRAAAAIFVGAMAAAVPAGGQQPTFDQEQLRPVTIYPGIQAVYARPVGEFRDYVQHGGGLNANIVWPVRSESALALRADGGFIVYGSETKRVCFSSTVGCRVQLDLTTTNSIGYLNAGPQLMVPTGAVRPYVNGAIGLAYFGTSSKVDGTGHSNEAIASTTNFDDLTFSWAGGGGLLVQLASGRVPVHLDLSARYYGNGEVEYLKKGDIQDNPDGSITFTPTRSQANLMTLQLGVTMGARPGRR